MKKTKLTNELFDGDTAIDSFPWLSLLDSVIWKIEQTQELPYSIAHSLNYSLIIDLAGVLEGFINQLLDEILVQRTTKSYTSEELDILIEQGETDKEKTSEFEYRVNDFIKNRIQQSNWSGYNEIFQLIFNKDMKNSTNPLTWKSISSLFTYRNMIVHGKVLTIDYSQIKDSNEYLISLPNKYQRVYSYLTENKLIKAGETGYVEMISNEIIQHYFNFMEKFMNEIINSIDSLKEKNRILSIFTLDNNLKKILPTTPYKKHS